MLGLSLKERLAKAIKRISTAKTEVYLSCLQQGYSEAVSSKEYYNSVFDEIWQGLGSKSPSIDSRIRLSIQEPGITGLPDKCDLDYLDERGFDAMATYAFMYYGITGKPIDMSKDKKVIDELLDYQSNIIRISSC